LIFAIQRSNERYFADHGWLRTYHSFSFADYYDPANLNWGALRVFNDDVIAPAAGFPTHPHRDMEIVTYVLEGELEHRDSMGNAGVVAPGGIQYMSAGTGIRHSEINPSTTRPLHLVQMWVLPAESGGRPAYGQVQYTQADRTGAWLTAASGRRSAPAQTVLAQDASLHVVRLESSHVEYAFERDRYGFLFVADGTITANGEHLATGDAVRMHALSALRIDGTGELVLWDLPAAGERSAESNA
jgi:redox-sensitive bicupin YhaK (pirin superfamily)